MKTALGTVLFQNPYATMGIAIDAGGSSITHRLEELEMESHFDEDGAGRRREILYARQLLEDARLRAECEFFSPWVDVVAYGPVAGSHDAALLALRRLMGPEGSLPSTDGLLVIAQWSALLDREDLARLFGRRLSDLQVRVPIDSWLNDVVVETILPEAVRRILSFDGGLAVNISKTLCALPSNHIAPAAKVLVEYVDGEIDDDRILGLPTRHVARLIPLVERTLAPARVSAPTTYYGKLSALVTICDTRASAAFRDGDAAAARRIIELLLTLNLLDSDRIRLNERWNF